MRGANLAAKGILSGFGFLNNSAGFDVNQTLIPFGPTDSVRRLYFVGLLNTLLVAVLGIIFATILGFVIGIARLSKNCAARAPRRRLCRIGPQPAALVPTAVLVSRRARHAAGDAGKRFAVRRDLPQQPRRRVAAPDPRRRHRHGGARVCCRACLRFGRCDSGRGRGRPRPGKPFRPSGLGWR